MSGEDSRVGLQRLERKGHGRLAEPGGREQWEFKHHLTELKTN